jgi:hypothetical protein
MTERFVSHREDLISNAKKIDALTDQILREESQLALMPGNVGQRNETFRSNNNNSGSGAGHKFRHAMLLTLRAAMLASGYYALDEY